MSDTMIALVIVPFLVALAVVLECTRLSCTWLGKQMRAAKVKAPPEKANGATALDLHSQR